MNSKYLHSPGGLLGAAMGVAALLLALCGGGAQAATVSGSARVDAALGKVVVRGRAAGLAPGSAVSIYSADSNMLLYTARTDGRRRFRVTLQHGGVPCRLRLETGDGGKLLVPVRGADASCRRAAACMIQSPAGDVEIGAGQSVEFIASARARRNVTMDFLWSLSDGSPGSQAASFSRRFDHPGQYRVTLNVADSTGNRCADGVVVRVALPNANPYPKVSERPAPATAEALNAADGAYVVMPFEDTGMQGGSQITLPFNPLTPYNALNAQVFKKIPRKPQIVDSTEANLFYSAASNPLDPVGADSINSTSQNLFAGGIAGVNFDPATTTCVNFCNRDNTSTTLVPERNYLDASIAKSEFWDRPEQPFNAFQNPPMPQRGQDIFTLHNVVTRDGVRLPTLPDEGRRGHVDAAKGTRAMPGIAAPYRVNDPQPLDYYAPQRAFIGQNIPVSHVDDKGRINPYPLFRVEARDAGGRRLAAADAVVTSASETGCRECHAKGGIGADDQVWRTPVFETELRNADGSPGPATGRGRFPDSRTPSVIPPLSGNLLEDFINYGYGSAVQNRFDDKHVAVNMGGLTEVFDDRLAGAGRDMDGNGLRADRIAESRWLESDGSTSPTNPGNDPSWRLQVRLRFKGAEEYGDPADWRAQEKAALYNIALLHDYMNKYYASDFFPGRPARDIRRAFATAFADQAEEKGRAPLNAMCAGHHTSQLKADVGAGAQAYQNVLSNYSVTMHAFHGKLQVYAREVGAGESADGMAHPKGDLIRDGRGLPLMYGGRGWDSMHFDDNDIRHKAQGRVTPDGRPLKADGTPAEPGSADDRRNRYDTAKNNWSPELFPMYPQGELLYRFGEAVPMEGNCLKCHTGKTEKSYRDIHHAAGLKCDNCHGDMLAVGNVFPNEKYDLSLTAGPAIGADKPNELSSHDFRRAWIDEPDCGSCHLGNANLAKDGDAGLNHYFSQGVLKQAWLDGDRSGTSMFPIDARFAVMPFAEMRPVKAAATQADVAQGLAARAGDTLYKGEPLSQALYRKSGDVHGSGANGILACSSCHGGSHAIWPNADPNANDNVTARQLQGYDGNIVECSVCHVKDDFKDGLVATDGGASNKGVAQGVREGRVVDASSERAYLAGPHGMHPVNDPYWWKEAASSAPNRGGTRKGGWHNDFAKKPGPFGEDQCAACHGSDHRGTRLSRTLTAREFVNERGRVVRVAADTPIGCNLCHSLRKSFTGVPTGQPRAYPPPSPPPIHGGGGGGGHAH
jgi:hypothetical protein